MRLYGTFTAFGCLLIAMTTSTLAAQSWSDQYPPTSNHGESPYIAEPEWLEPFSEPDFIWGSHPGLFVESTTRIFVIQRGELHVPDPLPDGFDYFYGSVEGLSALSPPEGTIRQMKNVIFVVNDEGKLIENWNQWDYLFEGTGGPHMIAISPYDPQRRVWVVNSGRHQIHAFSNDGKELLMTLGIENETANDETHLGTPQDLAFLSDGSIVVADGLTNSRVIKFDKDGNYLTAWGSEGNGVGQFDAVHSIATDNQDRIYVADRNNDRIQVFSPNGNHLATWPGLNFPNYILITENQDVWVSDNQPVRIIKFDTDGNRLFSWDAHGNAPGEFGELHEFGVDINGNWYGADNVLGRSQKFSPKPGADAAQLLHLPVPMARR
jgi:DNA-binding beta-propeller fold protein YncE